ncbi:5'-3' exonuclease [Kribbia dieselivorans]|uniref:5'-3' exonuclease n=1 Tax=Kribbia dieselivorans TaxID=331526 RepID=UPI0008395FAF|nr:5'-3' exonuclease [Kribbia dieselivorans]
MASTSPTLLLIDTASLYFRAFHGVPDRRSSPGAPPNNALRGFLDMVATLIGRYRPTHFVACWDDDWRPQFRVDAIPSYKAHRLVAGSTHTEETPEALLPQVPVIAEAIEALGLLRVGAAGYEADDVIGSYVAQRGRTSGLHANTPTLVVTGDRDLFQLVDDEGGVRIVYTARGGVRDPDVITQAVLTEKYGVRSGAAYADMAVLRGDPSDGLPGVPGIGEKTAAKLLAAHGSLGAIRAAAGDGTIGGAQRGRILEAADYLDVAPMVVRVAPDAPLPEVEPALPREPTDPDTLARIGDAFGVEASVARVVSALGDGNGRPG